MDYGIFNVHTDVSACDCTRGVGVGGTDTERESALNVCTVVVVPLLLQLFSDFFFLSLFYESETKFLSAQKLHERLLFYFTFSSPQAGR